MPLIGPILTRETAIVALSEKKSALNEQPESCFIDIQRGNTGKEGRGGWLRRVILMAIYFGTFFFLLREVLPKVRI
jgi:hypothetical protein